MTVVYLAFGLYGNAVTAAVDLESDVADQICACLAPEHAKLDEAAEAFGAGDNSAMMEATDMLPALKAESAKCTGSIGKKYASRDQVFKDNVVRFVDERCPRSGLPGGVQLGGVPLMGAPPILR